MNHETGKSFEQLVQIMAKLRSPEGCPWDREQTHETLKKYAIEETYEVIDAVDSCDMDELREELGDLLLQILFHAQIASENGEFDIADVIEGISSKLIRRHPHVFGNASADTADEVLHRWEKIKASEKSNEQRTSILDGVPSTLPALSRAMDISKKAAKAGFEWPDIDAVVEKLEEEVDELKAELHTKNRERIEDEIGDLLFTVVNIARWAKIDPEDALRSMTRRFAARFRRIEEAAKENGQPLQDMTIEEMDTIWDRAKREN